MLTHRPFRSSLHTQGRALLALLAAGAVAGCRGTPAAPQQPPTVEVAVAVEAEGDRALRLSGTIEAERFTALSFSVPGTIQEVRAADGARVVRGRVLARLDPRTFQDAVGIAELEVEQAEDAARRLEPMHRNGTIPDIKWVEVDTGLRQARLALSMAKKSLEDTVLRAPQDGVVARRLVEPGGTALPGSPAFVLVQSRTMLATAPLPEREVATVRVEIAESVTTASITAIQPVFVGGRIANGHELAVLGVEIAREGVAMARRDAVAQREKERIARTRLADAPDEIQLEIEKRRDDLWTAWRTVADLLEAQVLLRQAHDLQTESRTEYWLARSSYRRAMGNP